MCVPACITSVEVRGKPSGVNSLLVEHGLLFPLHCGLQASWPKSFLAILLPLPPSCHRSTVVSPSICSPQLFSMCVCVACAHMLHCACGSQETIGKIQFFPSPNLVIRFAQSAFLNPLNRLAGPVLV